MIVTRRPPCSRRPSQVSKSSSCVIPSSCLTLLRLAGTRAAVDRGGSAMATIVVGVDSSDGAKRALAFALEEARLRGATLRAVYAWSFAPIAASAGMFAPPVEVDFAEFEESANRTLQAVL